MGVEYVRVASSTSRVSRSLMPRSCFCDAHGPAQTLHLALHRLGREQQPEDGHGLALPRRAAGPTATPASPDALQLHLKPFICLQRRGRREREEDAENIVYTLSSAISADPLRPLR